MVSKARTTGKPVVVAGCVPQGQPDRDDLAGVSIVGVQQIHRVVEIVEEAVVSVSLPPTEQATICLSWHFL